jgi:hypothetical protein
MAQRLPNHPNQPKIAVAQFDRFHQTKGMSGPTANLLPCARRLVFRTISKNCSKYSNEIRWPSPALQ